MTYDVKQEDVKLYCTHHYSKARYLNDWQEGAMNNFQNIILGCCMCSIYSYELYSQEK